MNYYIRHVENWGQEKLVRSFVPKSKELFDFMARNEYAILRREFMILGRSDTKVFPSYSEATKYAATLNNPAIQSV